jgi:hypothetical protein
MHRGCIRDWHVGATAAECRIQRDQDRPERIIEVIHSRVASGQTDRRLFGIRDDRSGKAITCDASVKRVSNEGSVTRKQRLVNYARYYARQYLASADGDDSRINADSRDFVTWRAQRLFSSRYVSDHNGGRLLWAVLVLFCPKALP